MIDVVGGVNYWVWFVIGEVVIVKVEEGVFDVVVDIF